MAFKARVFFIVFLSIFLYGSQAREGTSDDVVVHLSVGKLRGLRESVSGTEREAESFYGIPYAEPPIGDLRFVPSKPAKGWSGVRNARKPGARCVYGRVMPPMAAKPASPENQRMKEQRKKRKRQCQRNRIKRIAASWSESGGERIR
ncbi:liver carboxylesterase 1F [Nematostella vectensis]|uniref:liver carboxylesterase 1F n=1 Tax=Nematostella vectensis TaxID=45351 RepID=UPI00138FC227|nr:liver carboxylesterase 1F [Nematostella vectensis]